MELTEWGATADKEEPGHQGQRPRIALRNHSPQVPVPAWWPALTLRPQRYTRTPLPMWPTSVVLTNESAFEEPNPPSLILEMRRRPKGAALYR